MTTAQMTLTAIPGIPLIRPGDELAEIILQCLADAGLSLQNGDVLVVAQKIVSKAEGRLVCLDQVQPSDRSRLLAAETDKDPNLVEVILSDSNNVVRHRRGVLIVEQHSGFVCANAGVDHSNIPARDGRPQVALLPADADDSAARLRARIREATGKDVAVIINDSHGRPFRLGTCGVALGVAGMAALSDRRGAPDLFGQPLRITTVGTADELAAAASALMGQGAEGRPVVVIRGAPFDPAPGTVRDLLRPRPEDLFREPVPPSELANLLYRRQTIRRYDGRAVDRSTVEALIAAACAAPSAHNRQHWRFAAITARPVKERLAQAMGESFRQDMRREGLHPDEIEGRAGRSYDRLVESPALIIAGYSSADVSIRALAGQETFNSGPASKTQHRKSKIEETMATQSVAAAIENLLVAATAMVLGACWSFLSRFCPDVVRVALSRADYSAPQALITIGYPAETPPRRERFPVESRAYFFLENET